MGDPWPCIIGGTDFSLKRTRSPQCWINIGFSGRDSIAEEAQFPPRAWIEKYNVVLPRIQWNYLNMEQQLTLTEHSPFTGYYFKYYGHLVLCLVTQSCPTLCVHMDCSSSGSSVHGDSPGKKTGMGCHALLQGIFPTQGLNPGLLALQADSLLTEPPGRHEQNRIW